MCLSLFVSRETDERGLISSFTAAGWQGSFYPKGMRPADYLTFYAEHFHTVEMDSTFFGCPSARNVRSLFVRG
jgi:uncharacterized protein YecE (DUF72 family)